MSKGESVDLETVRKRRTVTRRFHTEAFNKLRGLFDDADCHKEEFRLKIEIAFNNLECKHAELCSYDKVVLDHVDGDEFGKEYETIDGYTQAWLAAQAEYRLYINRCDKASSRSTDDRVEERKEAHDSQLKKRFNMKYPRMDIDPFDGSPKHWLGFWSSFKKLDESHEFDDDDRMHYLYQFTKDKARQVVEIYPKEGAHYRKALEHLKERFANDKILVRYYIRQIYDLIFKTQNKQLTLSHFYHFLEGHLQALTTLGLQPDKFCDFLLPLLEAALYTDDLLKTWNRYRKDCIRRNTGSNVSVVSVDSTDDDLQLFLDFLKEEVESLDSIKEIRDQFPLDSKLEKGKASSPSSTPPPPPTASILYKGQQVAQVCNFCDANNHATSNCSQARDWEVKQRRKHLEKRRICFRCLEPGHVGKQCKQSASCLVCKGGHHILLCEQLKTVETHKGKKKETKGDSKQQEKKGEVKNLNNFNSSVALDYLLRHNIYLPTLQARLVSAHGSKVVRVLLDTGSQKSYVLNSVARELHLESKEQETVTNILFGNVQVPDCVYDLYEIELCSLCSEFSCKITVRGEEVICEQVPRLPDSKLPDFEVSFLDYGEPCPIMVSIGSDLYGFFLTGNIQVASSGLAALETKFGWTLFGGTSSNTFSLISTCVERPKKLSDLWDLESLGIMDPGVTKTKALLAQETLDHFNKTITRSADGRYEIVLPWTRDKSDLGTDFQLALKRLEKVRNGIGEFFYPYDDVFKLWESLNVIVEVEGPDRFTGHFLPHRPVISLHKASTPVRPVFDASAHSQGQPSLNDCLSTGPNLLESIIPLLIRFRFHRIGVIADIEKAFLQIKVNELDQPFLKFLWYNEKNEIKVYQHQRVVFGVCASPFVLNATLAYHFTNFQPNELISESTLDRLKTSFYVDDCVTSVSTLQELQKFKTEADIVMKDALFNLRGWTHTAMTDPAQQAPIWQAVLGLKWDIVSDTLACDIRVDRDDKHQELTKRRLLSIVNRIFDPLGITAPATIIPKILIQQTWELQAKWDEPLPDSIMKKAQAWINECGCLTNCQVPRWFFGPQWAAETTTLHVFCDASAAAYAGCIFLRSELPEGVRVQLVLAKSRVAPLKRTLTIPKLELMAASIAARLYTSIKDDFLNFKTHFWSDSTIALTWIKTPGPWMPFVDNRVQEIVQLTNPADWRHVSGVDNPADLPSRGCSPKELFDGKWWEGPSWLYLPEKTWISNDEFLPDGESVPERRKTVLVNVKSEVQLKPIAFVEKLLYYFSTYTEVVRSLAVLRRFTEFLVAKYRKNKFDATHLASQDIDAAENFLLRYAQRDFSKEKCHKVLRNLPVFQDANNITRVQTRLLPDTLLYTSTPILLPHTSRVTAVLVREKHEELCHAGTNMIMTSLRESFWLLFPRRTIRKAIKDCFVCERYSARSADVPMPALPLDRVKCEKAFQVIGVDLAGPLILLDASKVWICLFTCSVYRALHLEIVESASTDSFLLALRRFIARRGRVQTIYSDHGGNFEGADNLFEKLDLHSVQQFCSTRRIRWKFNPPTASWWGGFWERLVGVIKRLLRKTLGKARLQLAELTTIVCEVEAVVNSRPLTYQSDEDNVVALTPSLFLQPNVEVDTVDLDTVDESNLRQRARYLLDLRRHLRQRFQAEYLSTLINRKKASTRPLQVGDVCLIGSDDTKRLEWPLGRIVDIIYGKDGLGRVIKLKTQNGIRTRPIQRVYPLEMSVPNTAVDATSSSDKETDLDNLTGLTDMATAPLIDPGSETPVLDSHDSFLSAIDSDLSFGDAESTLVESSPDLVVTRSGRTSKPVKRFDL